MDFWRSLDGMLVVELTSADLAAAFAAINGADISLFCVTQVDTLTARFQISRNDYAKMACLADKRGEKLKIVRHLGLYWFARRLCARPVLIMGIGILLVLSLALPTRVLFVRMEGNETVPNRRILAAAEDCGIRFGASRRQVRSEQVKNALLEAVPELQWAGVNTYGCTAIISVRERPMEEEREAASGVAHVEAVRDGVILSVTATKGTALVQPGQAVKAGEILISGYWDCGICIRAGQAEGEVFARTNREIRVVTPESYDEILEESIAGRKISLLLGKKRINLWKDSGISGTSCGRMYEEYYITLPGGYRLPVAVCVDTYRAYRTAPSACDPEAAEEALRQFARQYTLRQMAAGQLLRESLAFSDESGVHRLDGDFVCTEMIGRQKREQIGELHGKDS